MCEETMLSYVGIRHVVVAVRLGVTAKVNENYKCADLCSVLRVDMIQVVNSVSHFQHNTSK